MRLRNFSSFRYFATSGASSICLSLSCADQCKRVSLGISLDSLEYFPVSKPLKELNSKSHALNIHCTMKNFTALEVLVIFFTLEQRILMIALKHDSSTSKQTPLEDSRAKHQDLRFNTRQTLRAPSGRSQNTVPIASTQVALKGIVQYSTRAQFLVEQLVTRHSREHTLSAVGPDAQVK